MSMKPGHTTWPLASMDGLLALDRLLGDRGNLLAPDADVALRVEVRFRVDDPTTSDHHVEVLVTHR
jgi:hypothetical protein